MTYARLAFFAAAAASCLGSAGMLVWGAALARSFAAFGSPDPSSHGGTLHESMLSGLSGGLFGFAAAMASMVLAAALRQRKARRAGLVLLFLAGCLTVVAGAMISAGDRQAAQAGEALSASFSRPTDEDLAPAAAGGRTVTAGCAILLAAQLLLLIGAVVLFEKTATPGRVRKFLYGFAAAAALTGLAVASISLKAGFDHSELDVVAATSVRPKPSELAACLLAMLRRTQASHVVISVLGAAQAALSLAAAWGRVETRGSESP